MDLGRFRDFVPLLVDCLPEDEREVINGLFWERAPLRTIAERLDWRLPDGDLDGKKVERVRDRALARIADVAERRGIE